MRAYPFYLLAGVIAVLPAFAQQDDKDKKNKPEPKPAQVGSIVSSEIVLGGKNLAEWIKQTTRKDPYLREQAVRMIGQFPPDLETKKKVIPVLVGLLDDRDAGVGASSLGSLQAFLKFEKDEAIDQKDFEKLIKALTATLTKGIAYSRLQSINALAQIGPAAKEAIKPLVGILVPQSARELHSWDMRRAAATALGRIAYDTEKGPELSAINALLKAMREDECAQVRLMSLFSIGQLGSPKDKEKYWLGTEQRILQQVVKEEHDESIRLWARVVLIKLDEANKPVAPFLLKRHEEYVNDLARILKRQSADPEIRAQAAQALGWLGATAKAEIGLLIQTLQDGKPAVAAAAAQSFSSMKTELSDANRETIAGIMNGKEMPQESRASAALALGYSESVGKIPELIKTLNDPELPVADAAATALGLLKDKLTNEHLSAIAGMLKNKNLAVETRRRAAQALGLIGAKSKVPDLVEALKDPDAGVANSAVLALASMKDNLERPHVEGIARLLQDKTKEVATRRMGAEALGLLGDKSKDFIGSLIDAAKDKDLTLAGTSISALAKLGKIAEAALPTLRSLQEHRDPGIREMVKQAIDDVQGIKTKKPEADRAASGDR